MHAIDRDGTPRLGQPELPLIATSDLRNRDTNSITRCSCLGFDPFVIPKYPQQTFANQPITSRMSRLDSDLDKLLQDRQAKGRFRSLKEYDTSSLSGLVDFASLLHVPH